MAGGVIIAAWGGFRNRIATIAFACSCFGFCTALLGIPLNFWVYLAVILVTSVFVPFFSSALTVLLQERIQSDMQGRIFSLLQIVVTAAMPLGMVLFGPLGDAIPIEVLLLATRAAAGASGRRHLHPQGAAPGRGAGDTGRASHWRKRS